MTRRTHILALVRGAGAALAVAAGVGGGAHAAAVDARRGLGAPAPDEPSAALGAPADARGAYEFLALDAQLRVTPLRVLSFEGDALRVQTGEGLSALRPWGDVLALLAPDDGGASASHAERDAGLQWLVLADGQRLSGFLTEINATAPAADAEPPLEWTAHLAGPRRVALEQIAAVDLVEGLPAFDARRDAPGARDALDLVNADTLAGFVARLGDPVVIEVDGQRTELPAERVARVRLANPPTPPGGPTLWLVDGSVVRIAEVRSAGNGIVALRATPPGDGDRPVPTPRVEVASVLALSADPARLTALASLALAQQAPTGGRRWSEPVAPVPGPAPLGAADVLLPGPVRVRWDLPANAARVGFLALLPAEARAWGDLELIVRVDGREAARHRLRAETPSAEVSLDVAGARTLEIEIDAGPTGPVQDRVLLRRGLILLAE